MYYMKLGLNKWTHIIIVKNIQNLYFKDSWIKRASIRNCTRCLPYSQLSIIALKCEKRAGVELHTQPFHLPNRDHKFRNTFDQFLAQILVFHVILTLNFCFFFFFFLCQITHLTHIYCSMKLIIFIIIQLSSKPMRPIRRGMLSLQHNYDNNFLIFSYKHSKNILHTYAHTLYATRRTLACILIAVTHSFLKNSIFEKLFCSSLFFYSNK